MKNKKKTKNQENIPKKTKQMKSKFKKKTYPKQIKTVQTKI